MFNNIGSSLRAFTGQLEKMTSPKKTGLEKAEQKLENAVSNLSARGQELCKQIQNCNSEKLAKMLDKMDAKLVNMSNKVIEKATNFATSMFKKMEGLFNKGFASLSNTAEASKPSGGALDGMRKSLKDLSKDFSKEFKSEGKSFVDDIKKNVKNVKNGLK